MTAHHPRIEAQLSILRQFEQHDFDVDSYTGDLLSGDGATWPPNWHYYAGIEAVKGLVRHAIGQLEHERDHWQHERGEWQGGES